MREYHLIYTRKDGSKVDTKVLGSSAKSVADDHKDKADSSGVCCWPVTRSPK